MSFQHRIVIGDWSHDGHNQEDYYTFECSHDEPEVKKAYWAAIKKCKVALHENNDKRLKGVKSVCCKYEDRTIKAPELKALTDLGVSFDKMENLFEQDKDGNDELNCSSQDIAYLFFEMVKTQIPGFEYKYIKDKKTINGFWSEDFNLSFGYGCFN
jgi:hypothetical protein